jgi:hypothetical protein
MRRHFTFGNPGIQHVAWAGALEIPFVFHKQRLTRVFVRSELIVIVCLLIG